VNGGSTNDADFIEFCHTVLKSAADRVEDENCSMLSCNTKAFITIHYDFACMAHKRPAKSIGVDSSRRRFLQAAGVTGFATTVAGCFGEGEADAVPDFVPEDAAESDPDGEPVEELDYVALSQDAHPIRYQWTVMHAENLQELGFEINHQAPAVPRYIELGFVERDFDMYPLRYGDGFDPEEVLGESFSQSGLAEGGGNVSGYEDEEYQEMLADSRAAVDEDDRQEIVFEMQEKVINEDHAITPVMVQNRPMPLNIDRWQNAVSQPENGLESFWNFINIEPTDENDDNQLRYGQAEDLSHLNPVNPERGRVERGAIRIIYDRLMRYPDDGGPPEPWAAENVERTDDTTVEVMLRDDLLFHDGEEVTASDVVFSYEFMEEHSSEMAGIMENVDEVEEVDDLTVRFHLSNEYASFEGIGLAGRTPVILPQHVWEDHPDDDGSAPSSWSNAEAIGSGPAVVEDIELAEEMQLSSFDDYFVDIAWDTAVRVEAADQRGNVSSLRDEAIDMIPHDVPVDDIEPTEEEEFIEMYDSLMTSTHYVCYNMRRDLFGNDVRVRHAFAYALSNQDALEVAGGGYGETIVTCFSPGLEFWYNDDVEPYEFDLGRSAELLADAGFQWNSDDGMIHYPSDW
jgi:peptide/nickel transport system substrate-binding protein